MHTWCMIYYCKGVLSRRNDGLVSGGPFVKTGLRIRDGY